MIFCQGAHPTCPPTSYDRDPKKFPQIDSGLIRKERRTAEIRPSNYARLTIDIAAMAHIEDQNDEALVLDAVDDPVLADAPGSRSAQRSLERISFQRLLRDRAKRSPHPVEEKTIPFE